MDSQGSQKAGCVSRKGRDEHCWMLVKYSQELRDVMEWRKLLMNRDKLVAEGESVKWEKIKLNTRA